MPQAWWHADSLARRRPFLAVRSAVKESVEAFFDRAGFVAVETPAVQRSPGLERHVRPLATRLEGPLGGPPLERYLHTSPEFAMKKLLAGGVDKIVQLCRVWRNDAHGPLHQPEFTMLEWYRANAGYETLMADCAAVLRAAADAAQRSGRDGLFRWRGAVCDVRQPLVIMSVADAFARYAGIDLLGTIADSNIPAPDPATLRARAKTAGVQTGAQDTWEDVFFHIMLERIEPCLGLEAPLVLRDYPANLAALARRKPGDPRCAERFELYVCGVELANAYGELTDPGEQRARFLHDQALHASLYGTAPPVDEDLLAALALMPPSAGAALGFDRLVMLASGATTITDVLWAPVE